MGESAASFDFKNQFFIQRSKTNSLKCSSLLQNSLRQLWRHIINNTNRWEEPGQWSTLATSTHAGSTLGPAVVTNITWKILVQVQRSQRSLIHNVWGISVSQISVPQLSGRFLPKGEAPEAAASWLSATALQTLVAQVWKIQSHFRTYWDIRCT